MGRSQYNCCYGICNSNSTPGRPGYDPSTKFYSFPQPCLYLRDHVLELDKNAERKHIQQCSKCNLCWDWMPVISKYKRAYRAPEPSSTHVISQAHTHSEAKSDPVKVQREVKSAPSPSKVQMEVEKIVCEMCDAIFVNSERCNWHRLNEHEITGRRPPEELERDKPPPALELNKPLRAFLHNKPTEHNKPLPGLEHDKPPAALEHNKPPAALEHNKPPPALRHNKPPPALKPNVPAVIRSDTVKITCEICDQVFENSTKFRRHRISEHEVNVRNPTPAKASTRFIYTSTGKKAYLRLQPPASSLVDVADQVIMDGCDESSNQPAHGISSESNLQPSKASTSVGVIDTPGSKKVNGRQQPHPSSLNEIMTKVITDACNGKIKTERWISIGSSAHPSKADSSLGGNDHSDFEPPTKRFLLAAITQSDQNSSTKIQQNVHVEHVESPSSSKTPIIQNASPESTECQPMVHSTYDENVEDCLSDSYENDEEHDVADDAAEVMHAGRMSNEGLTHTEMFLRDTLAEDNQILRIENAALKASVEELERKLRKITNDDVCLKNEKVKQQISHEITSPRADIEKLEAAVVELKSEIKKITKDNISLRSELQESKLVCKCAWDESSFEGNDAKTKFYTGIPTFTLLRGLFELVKSDIPPVRVTNCSLSNFQELLLVLIRLRVGLLYEDLAFRFRSHTSKIGRLLSKWIKLLASKLSSLIVWPDRGEARKTYPQCVRDVFGDRFVVIVDVLELFLGDDITTNKSTSSTSVKFLIGYTPQGTVCYVSEMWTTDRVQFTELLDQIQPEDIVIAGKNFVFAEELGLHLTSSGFQVYTKSKSQLPFQKNIRTRETTFLRQRVTSLIKKRFRLLQGGVNLRSFHASPTNGDATVLRNTVILCCGLINMCQPVEPSNSEEVIYQV